ncbi:BrnT family toxin [Granulicella mallensis]|jgi:uncharacterized protein|uniref:BrnT family toxin n=1 Tax=Granulicella mallensis TaxID=940614 RepID=A0A7W7ZLB7_9BACT|nr:BrnT family toxin [Granulicella mallensis]MBB5062034.1 hypothetical protein [Granulicella mallensis]
MFDWDEANITHIAEHDVLPSEAEEVIANSPLDLGYSSHNDETRYREVGETLAGRILVVVSTLRNGLTRVVTAYPPSRALRLTYLEYKEFEQNGEENPS